MLDIFSGSSRNIKLCLWLFVHQRFVGFESSVLYFGDVDAFLAKVYERQVYRQKAYEAESKTAV